MKVLVGAFNQEERPWSSRGQEGRGVFKCTRDWAHLVAALREAGDVGGEDEGQHAHVGEHLATQVRPKLVVRLKYGHWVNLNVVMCIL